MWTMAAAGARLSHLIKRERRLVRATATVMKPDIDNVFHTQREGGGGGREGRERGREKEGEEREGERGRERGGERGERERGGERGGE